MSSAGLSAASHSANGAHEIGQALTTRDSIRSEWNQHGVGAPGVQASAARARRTIDEDVVEVVAHRASVARAAAPLGGAA